MLEGAGHHQSSGGDVRLQQMAAAASLAQWSDLRASNEETKEVGRQSGDKTTAGKQ
jgi:hypothetical protein